MQPVSRIQGIALFSIVAVLLFALVWGGLIWAKGRSDHYAAQTNGAAQPAPIDPPEQSPPKEEQPQPTPDTPPQQSTSQPSSTPKSEVAGAQTKEPTQAHAVPSTGPEDIFLTVLTVTLTGFVATKYFQQRRRLMSYR